MITVMQWNARSLRANYPELQHFANQFHPTIIALQETWLKPHLTFNLTNYYLHRQDRKDRGGGGLAFYIHRNITAYPIPTPVTNDELDCIQITHPTHLRILNFYHPPGPITNDTLSTINNLITGPTLIVGDFNSHHAHWGNPSSDANGTRIYDWAVDNHLTILNDSSPTHLNRDSTSSIDLTLITPDLLPLASWHAHPSLLGSDHFPLITSIPTLNQTTSNPHLRPLPPPPHWPTYSALFMSNLRLPTNNLRLTLDSLVVHFNNAITTTVRNTRPSPPNSNPPRHPPLPWWTSACTRAIRDRNQALWRARRTFLDDDWNNYKQKKAMARRTLRQAKRDHWNHRCQELDCRSNVRTLYRLINNIRGKHHHPTVRYLIQGNSYITSPEGIANALAHSFTTKDFPPYAPSLTLSPFSPLPSLHSLYLNSDICPHELSCALSTARDSTPGQDGIRLSHLKYLPPDGHAHFLSLLNRSWADSELPASWKHSIIIPIPKPNKPPHLTSAYRPISLTSIPCKILERILNCRLTHFLETNNLLPPTQAGFRSHRSIFSHITALAHDAVMAINRHHVLALTLLDLKQAYDSIPHSALLAKLSGIGVTGRMLGWIAEFLTHRTLQVRVNQVLSSILQSHRGVPQGSVLSPTLFNIMLSDIPIPDSHNIHIALYADDIAIWTESSQPSTASNRTQRYINKLQDWATTWGLEFSPTKSEFTIISHIPIHNTPNITMYNQPIPHKAHVKYLGTTFDHTLTWTPHLTQTKRKIITALNALRCVSGLHWGTTRNTMLHLFRSLIRPHLDFNANILPHTPRIIRTLQILQNRALRLCLGARNSTSIEALHLEAQEPPISFRWQYLSIGWTYKQLYHNVDRHFHRRWSQREASHYYQFTPSRSPLVYLAASYINTLSLPPPISFPTSPMSPPPDPITHHATFLLPEDSGLNKSLPFPAIQEIFFRICDRYPEHILMATDGSVQDTAAGVGIFSPHLNLHLAFRLPDSTCITSAELYALWHAYTVCPSGKPRIIITDSLAALQAILHCHPNNSNHIVKTIRHAISTSPNPDYAIFLWVPSHQSIIPNDTADHLAAKGRALQHTNDPNLPPLTFQDCKKLVRRTIHQQWMQAHQHKIIQYPHLLTLSSWPSHLFSSRYTETAITRLRLGHSFLKDSLAQTGANIDRHCSL